MADFGLNLLGPKYAFFVYYSHAPMKCIAWSAIQFMEWTLYYALSVDPPTHWRDPTWTKTPIDLE